MYLIANGCSHTSGAEIEYVTQDSCYSKAWPQHLGKKLDFEVINLARSGASCKRVIRTTIDCVGNLFLKGIKPEELFVIVLWPGPYRTEIYQDSFKDNALWEGWIPLVVGNDKLYKKQYDYEIYKYYKSWSTTTLNPKAANINYYNDIILLQSYVKSFKIKYRFWIASTTTLARTNISLAIQIDRKYFISAHDGTLDYLSLLKSNKFNLSFKYSTHYGEDAHIFFADHLYKKIGKLYDY